ncbi:YagU family protein [Campylobacter canadensis]|uniref:DUF1440 domain-containing protein n=1 Tax=Campylobacter canadensis TaxID=449520 RepID=A0ABS7WS05_9BACT|nr:DUF1440 domain-containing protein [Campylobacter canadensis]MBZ7987112.1 DUF1440 domain-containing protein [Campylobacter canadensis]MBZ7994726.1 DUF1440 domain-containing protein [Campylobacter canadensis]MBZ7996222.1 DUF1440 domain-containing protein [Campylobacter canadensis]MBZ7998148.1 DUF1440 domain-containing protein [Campylobacter canadensis]MBZ7999962.1 DUF1440 domain-containing protein [Campylobacter canadensis]
MKKNTFVIVVIGIIAGIFSGIVKWGWEVPFPPRNPNVAWPVDALERTTPPKIFLEQLNLPTDWVYTFSGVELPLSIFIVHISFAIVFAVFYCLLAERYAKVTMCYGAVFGIVVDILAHVIVMPLIKEVPPLAQIPFDEHLSEFFGHIIWLYSIEIVRRDLKVQFKRFLSS